MKRLRFQTVILLSACLVFAGCQTPSNTESASQETRSNRNRVLNGDLETLFDGAPENWDPFDFGGSPPGDHSLDFDPHTRNHALTVQLDKLGASGWRQKVQLDPDTSWMMNCKVKTESVAGNGLGATLFFPVFRYMDPPAIRNAADWTVISAELVNAGFVDMDLTCSLGAYGGNTGKAWFDDIIIAPQIDPARDPATTTAMTWGPFSIRYNNERGYLTSLRAAGLTSDDLPEYLGSYPTLPHLDHQRDHFVGDVAVDVQINGAWERHTTADSGVKHRVEPAVSGLRATHGFPVSETAPDITTQWTLEDTILTYSITITNKTGEPMVIGSIDLPFPWNDNYCLFNPHDKNSQRLLYTRRVAEHKHIGGVSSYILVSPMDGLPPYLLITPGDKDSGFEFAYHSPDTIRNQVRDSHRWIHGAWPGLTRICFHSAGVVQRFEWSDWFLGHTQLQLEPGETHSFTVNLQWIEHRNHLEPAVGQSGGLGVTLIPGPAVPIGETVTARVFGATPPLTIDGKDIQTITKDHLKQTPAEDKTQSIAFVMNQPGEQVLTVRDSQGKTGRLIMMGLPSIPDLLAARTGFIRDKQVFHESGHPCDGAILCWNNRAGSCLANPRDMWGSGGYEGGVTDAQFMALKNLYYPEASEIRLLETYIHDWFIGKIQNRDTWGVAWMVGEPNRIERGYNYIHVLNLYDAMARTAETWPQLFTHNTPHYMDLWMNTFRAFNARNVNYRDLGLMGRGNIVNMPELFRRWNREPEAAEIDAEIARWAEYWSQAPAYPYGSELFFDNTGYETVTLYCDYDLRHNASLTDEQKTNRRNLIEQTINVTEAGRGRASSWFWNDSDQRWWDAVRTEPAYAPFTDFGENCHHYMTGLNGYMLLDMYDQGYNREETAPVGFSGILAQLGRITDTGFAGMCYCPDPSSANVGLNQFTGDVGLGLWGSLLGFRCYVIRQESGDLSCLGGRMDTSVPDSVTVQPWPGCDHRIRWLESAEVFFDARGWDIRTITRSESGDRWIVNLVNNGPVQGRSHLVIRGVQQGTWAVTWNENSGKTLDSTRMKIETDSIDLERDVKPGSRLELTVARQNE